MSNIHPTAIIEEGATIGKNVKIGPFVTISSQSIIGDNTVIDAHANIVGKTTIGDGNHIFSHAVVGSIPQDLKFSGEDVELIIGNNNKIREFTLINPGTKGGGSITKIGNNNLFMGYVHIGHDVIIENNCILANGATLAGHVELGNNVVIGGLTPVHQFVHIGDFAMIAGASALSQDIPPYCLAEGNRATLRGLNLTGLRRHLNRDDINELKVTYRELFESSQALQEIAERLLKDSKSEIIKNLLTFITKSKRGIPYIRKNING
ncbi:Acyl-[acyl-carrier-protein]--UDP-N-acetylglucosamine O-acyltransferase [hydrothermal vent metagenome]|uniref:Acyl-[acyl-carrier-protein]--UDP-N-acetylglucosamine O-acyltransferase n=1 Tax=hydrothermal vent metagenome TaxID=652676 RepID=A0A1W1CT66_9ZZZZ